ncbi:MAG: ABC transporter substrate-binding protein [Pseudomonadota bacterium]
MKHLAKTLIAACLAGTLSLPALADPTEPTGTFRFAHDVGSGTMSSLDPIANGRILTITEKLMSRLVRPGVEGIPQPDLATAWQANEDGTVWTFDLREGVTFHDGSTFDAGDVVYSLNRILDPASDSPAKSVIAMVTGVEALDDMTVQLTLESTFADLPLQLMDPRLRIVPEGSGDTIAQSGIGTGPFKVEKFDADGVTVLTAFEDYYEGTPLLARMEVYGIPDEKTRLQAFLAGQLDMERGIKPLVRRALNRSDAYVVQEIPTGNWSGLVFRTDVEPFNNVRVRRAMRMAVDREEMLKLALDGGGIISCDTPVAPSDQYRADMECPRDVEGAKAFLAQAGYPDGLKIKLHVAAVDAAWEAMALIFQDHLAAAGIKVEIVNASADGYWSEVWMKKDAFATSWGERPGDQALNEPFQSQAKWNESYFQDYTFDSMLRKARSSLDFFERRNYYVAAQQYLVERSGTLIPFHRTQLVGLSPRVKGLPGFKSDRIRWHQVRVEDAPS